MQLVYMPWWQHNILTDMPTFFQIITTVLLFDCNCGSLHIWAICDENNHCTKKSTPPSCNYGFEYPCQQAKCTFPIRVPVIGGLFYNLICRAGGRVLYILQFNSEIKRTLVTVATVLQSANSSTVKSWTVACLSYSSFTVISVRLWNFKDVS